MHEYFRRQSFLDGIGRVGEYLKEKFGDSLKPLSNSELGTFARGWSFEDAATGTTYKVLIPPQFPHATPRIAIEDTANPSRDFGKEFPHVEEHGLLCLPAIEPSATEVTAILNKMLGDAFKFVADYSANPDRSRQEFQREFISYWNRQRNGGNILSLANAGGGTRIIFFGEGRDEYWIAADSVEDIYRWYLNKHHTTKKPAVYRGLFIKLDEAPAPPFPENPSEFDAFIEKYAPQYLESFRANTLHPGPYLVIMSADSETGTGLMGISFIMTQNAPNPFRGGFRGTAYMPPGIRKMRFNESHKMRRHQVYRADHDWVHGRGADSSQEQLKKASVVILGCGAVGSHVAVRLAQAGVGSLFLIDPELLDPANVGRHALGMNNLHTPKSQALALEIRQRFPHIRVNAFYGKWEDAVVEHSSEFESANLIVSATASWASEGPLNEWHASNASKPPILYGWTEPRAIASHAVLIQEPGACLHCLIDESGRMRAPETEGWPNEDGVLFEPACGALFQPFGPIDLANAESLVANLAVATLTGENKRNTHMVHVTSENRASDLGGRWTDIHRQHRPSGFNGSFQYERTLSRHAECPYCSK